jgi:hypothetical protein
MELYMDNSWALIANGEFEKAIEKATADYTEGKSSAAIHHRAIANLMLKNYNDALKDYLFLLNRVDEFYENNKYYNDNIINKSDSDYINAGVTCWLLNDYEQAVKMWIDSMTLRLRYTGNYMIPPCIVYFAGVYLHDAKILKSANKCLQKRAKGSITLGKYLLNETTENELLSSIKLDSPIRNRSLCQYEFYIAAKHLENGDNEGFIQHLRRCVEMKGNYLEFEYFLAVGELDKMNMS